VSEPADSTVDPSAGVDEESAGFVLSTRRSSTGTEAAKLPASSVATTRRSYRPSAAVVVSQFCGTVVHVFAFAGERW
jgi:hypothetical protein